jgi:hypothetical protein
MATLQKINVTPIVARNAPTTSRVSSAPRASLNARGLTTRAMKLSSSNGIKTYTDVSSCGFRTIVFIARCTFLSRGTHQMIARTLKYYIADYS